MMDACRTSKEQYYYSDEAEEKDLISTPIRGTLQKYLVLTQHLMWNRSTNLKRD